VNDQELWDHIRRGDAAAFGGFYRENAPRVQAFLRHFLGSREAAEDVMQETFTGIWQRPNGFMAERGTLRTYLFGIARKRAAEWWRKQTPSGLPAAEDSGVASAENASLFKDALSQLQPEQRILLWLREVEGQSYSELSEILNVPVGTVRSRLFAARQELRQLWLGPRPRRQEEL
jgi:RNA polymerase sigma-70 factor (ECF subfamily)